MRRYFAIILVALTLSGCAGLKNFFSGGDDADGKRAEKAVGPVEAAASAPRRRLAAYTLEVDAPAAPKKLLIEHLDLARFQRTEESDRLSTVELDRLSSSTPAQARALLETEGYFNAHVVLTRRPATAGAPELVHVAVESGPQARVSALSLDFAGELAGAKAAEGEGQVLTAEQRELQQSLRHDWALGVGQPFSQSRWSSAKTALLVRARAAGFPLAEWRDTQARVEAQSNEVELALTMDSGPLYHLGSLQIEGLKYQDEATVRRLAGFEPGAPYTEKALTEFQERLIKTQLFDSATVDILPDPSRPELAQAVPVLVHLREAARQQATTGVGFDANTGQRVTLEYLNRVPFGLPLRARSKLILGRDLRSAELEVSSHPQPDMSRNLASMLLEQDLSGDQDVTNLSARVGRLRETRDDDRLVYLELLRARELTAEADGTRDTVTSGAYSANVQWTRRRIDSLLLPTDGHQGQLLLGIGRADNSIAASGVFGKVQFKRLDYKPLGNLLGGNWFLDTRVEFGEVIASDAVGIPEKLLFKAGGDDSVRGYAYETLGPTVNGAVVGGRVMATGSVEIARPISKTLPDVWGVLFVDAGNAAADWRSFKPAWGYGFGVHWRSPVGPLRIDIARGVEVQRWRLHFSVGIAL